MKVLARLMIVLALALFTQAGLAKFIPGESYAQGNSSRSGQTLQSPLLAQSDDSGKNAGDHGQATKRGEACITCHQNEVSPGAVAQWHDSKHSKAGVSCIDCHGANKDDVDSWLHRGEYISSIVTPRDCAQCHSKESTEFQASHHSTASLFIGSLDNYLGAFVEGHPATVSGCKQCHGSRLKLSKHFTDGTDFNLDMEEVSTEAMKNLQVKGLEPRMSKEELSAEMVRLVNEAWAPHKDKELKAETDGIKIDKDTWPNSGMGRINADGSMGSCNACHSRHTFSKALARQPDNCGKCHMGPDHPQIEIYNESKHGIAFRNRLSQMNLDHPEWVVGKDYSAAPTCATCHMSRTKTQPVTHDVGLRISYTLRPVISKLTTSHSAVEDEFGEVKKITLTGPEKRERMKEVCSACHGPTHINNFYEQYDQLVSLYNKKFATPATNIMEYIKKKNYVNSEVPFGSDIEWKYYELWHHEGRRMRMGASMMAPDYTQWHGAFEVARNFYFHFLPLAEEIAEKHQDKGLKDLIAQELSAPEHQWMKGLSMDQRKQMLEFYQKRYGENSALIEPKPDQKED
ncbi:MAG: hydroxylamine oxidoreductase [Cyanobacteria bacterium HKST-UBA02]|nr:hydroxylamine oxidoreductase [Cyanobacteria bacterium HKST-UBA02]